MSETRADVVTLEIYRMLCSSSSTPSKPSMFRVGDHLRSINPEAYDPRIIAIGPLIDRNKPHLQKMEQHKVRYLELFLQRGGLSVEGCVTTVRHLEDRARKCYAEDMNLDGDKFVQMLILDGCFIVVYLLLKSLLFSDVDPADPIFQYQHIENHLFHDLMLFENQIPFFIVNCLFNMIMDGDIKSIIWPFVEYMTIPMPWEDFLEVPINEYPVHLLGIVHDIYCSSFAKSDGFFFS